jgi:hypothetical protein
MVSTYWFGKSPSWPIKGCSHAIRLLLGTSVIVAEIPFGIRTVYLLDINLSFTGTLACMSVATNGRGRNKIAWDVPR